MKCSHPENEPLVKLMHGSLQLAALVLPFLVVAHRLLRGPLPGCRTCYVVHVVHPAHWVHPALPPADEGAKQLEMTLAKSLCLNAELKDI